MHGGQQEQSLENQKLGRGGDEEVRDRRPQRGVKGKSLVLALWKVVKKRRKEHVKRRTKRWRSKLLRTALKKHREKKVCVRRKKRGTEGA